jgi:hypothetical protein
MRFIIDALAWSLFQRALMPRISHPMSAIQLDTPAVSPTRNATPSVGEEEFPRDESGQLLDRNNMKRIYTIIPAIITFV